MLIADSSISLYEQLKFLIKDDIVKKVYKPGEKMPSEVELGERYNVSRITVRRAIKELVNEGLLVSRQGKGTFVQYSKLHSKILSIDGFTNIASSEGHKPQTIVLSKTIIEAPDKVCECLNLQNGVKVLELKRMLIDNDSPLSIDIAYFPIDIFPDIIYKISDNISTFKVMREEYGVVMKKAYKEFSVTTANIEQSKLLNCSPGEPLFLIDKTIYNQEDKPIHFSNFLVLSSRVTYSITVEKNEV